MKKTILAIGVILLFICMVFVPAVTSIEIKSKEKEEQIETLEEPDYTFDSVEIELHGKANGWSISGTYARWWRIPILFTDYEYLICYCFKFWIEEKIPGRQLELVEGYFNITTPDGETLIVEDDGDTHIDYVSGNFKRSRAYEYNEPYYYFKGTLRQGVEIYL